MSKETSSPKRSDACNCQTGLPKILRRVIVSQVFWNLVFQEFPILWEREDYRNLFWYLNFGSHFDKESNLLLISARFLSQIENRSRTNTRAEAFLQRFLREVIPEDGHLMWTHYKWREGRKGVCRQVLSFGLGGFDEVVKLELRGDWDHRGCVYLDGTAWSAAKHRMLREKERCEASARPGLCEDAKLIQTYLNSLSPNSFNKVVKERMRASERAAMSLPEKPKCDIRRQQLNLLRSIESQPQPMYQASGDGNTVRLFSNSSICNLQGDVRRTLTQSWVEADLKAAQLAICASLWNCSEINEILASGVNFWNYALELMAVPRSDRNALKPEIKETLYSICFGMPQHCLAGQTALRLVKAGLNKDYAFRFLNIPIIREILLPARSEALTKLKSEGGGITAYGKLIAIDNRRDESQVMAEIAQSYEMKLIMPAFELAEKTTDFAITLYQFDGFSVYFTRREDSWKRRITDAVAQKAEELNIQTALEWKESASPNVYSSAQSLSGVSTSSSSANKPPKCNKGFWLKTKKAF